jgi:hypothetical protein
MLQVCGVSHSVLFILLSEQSVGRDGRLIAAGIDDGCLPPAQPIPTKAQRNKASERDLRIPGMFAVLDR